MMGECGTSIDGVLGGRLRLRQPLSGHRVGHDAILLAAATGARTGECALELGAGVGAAGLALAARVAGLRVVLVEIDQDLAALAAENARRNGFGDRVRAIACDAEDLTALASAGIAPGSADRVLMNPPFRDATRTQVSPDARRRLAHAGDPGLLGRWVVVAHALLRAGGTLTVIWHANAEARLLDTLDAGFGAIALLRIHPRPGGPAIRVLARAVKGGDRSRAEHAPLVLNDAHGRPSAAAEAVLRGGSTLSLACL